MTVLDDVKFALQSRHPTDNLSYELTDKTHSFFRKSE